MYEGEVMWDIANPKLTINPTNRLKFWFFCKPKHQWAEAIQRVNFEPTFVLFNTLAMKEPTKAKTGVQHQK